MKGLQGVPRLPRHCCRYGWLRLGQTVPADGSERPFAGTPPPFAYAAKLERLLLGTQAYLLMQPRRLYIATLLAVSPALQVACESTSSSCFGGSTWISLPRGRRRLRDIRVGDEVQSFDVRSGRLEVRPVTRVFKHGPKTVGQLLSRAGAGPRGVTSNHPIFLETQGDFTPAGEMTHDHPSRKGLYWDNQDLRSIDLEAFRAGPEKHKLEVYNLSIADTETYFADGLLVHNKSPNPCEFSECPEDGFGGQATGGAPSGGQAGAAGSAGSAGEGGEAP